MILDEAHRHMAEVGYARFSAREVAKRIGYSVGTVINLFGDHDLLVLAINARTLAQWSEHVETALSSCGDDRIDCLVRSYFAFAEDRPQAWAALYDHRLPAGRVAPDWHRAALERLTGIAVREVARALPHLDEQAARELAQSLLATVHGHCVLALTDTFALLAEAAPVDAARARVAEAVAAARSREARA